MAWLTDWFSVTDKTLQRWRERGQLQRLADVLRDDRHRALHRVALRELGVALSGDKNSGPPAVSGDGFAELLADWAEREPDSSLPTLRRILPAVPQGTRSRIVARLASFHVGRKWLVETYLDPSIPAETAAEVLRGLAPRPEDLEAIPRNLTNDSARAERLLQLGRAVSAGAESHRMLRRLLDGHGALRDVGVELAREHVERVVAGSRELSEAELGMGVEVGRRDPSWLPKLLSKTEKPAALVGLALAASREQGETHKTADSLVELYRRLPAESPARAELLPRLRELKPGAAAWLEVYRASGPSLRPAALDALLESGQLGALPMDGLKRLLLDEQGRPERFPQILESIRGAGRNDVIHSAYAEAVPFAKEALFAALQKSGDARFFESILNDPNEVKERRQSAARRLFEAMGERGLRQVMEGSGTSRAGELRELLLEVYLAAETPDNAAKTLAELVAPITETDLHTGPLANPLSESRSEERRLRLVNQFLTSAEGPSTLLRLLQDSAGQPHHDAIVSVARKSVEARLQKPDASPLEKDETTLLNELARTDVGWFRELLRRGRAKGPLIDAAIDVAWRMPLAQNPIELLVGIFKQGSTSDKDRLKLLKAFIKHRAGVETYVDLYRESGNSTRSRKGESREPEARQKLLKILEEHPRVGEIPRDFLVHTLLNEITEKQSRAPLFHILERRGEMSLLEEVYGNAASRQRGMIFDLLSEIPAIGDSFYERVLMDSTEDPKRRLGAAARLTQTQGRGGLTRLLESQEPAKAQEIRRWLIDRYLNRATPTMEAGALLKGLAPAQPRDIEVLDASTSLRAFEGRLLELGRAAVERPGAVPVLLRLMQEGDETLRSVAEVLALEHLEKRAGKSTDLQFEGEDLSLAIELGSLYKDWLVHLVTRVERPKGILDLVLTVLQRSRGDRVRGLLAELWKRRDLDAGSRHRVLGTMADLELRPEIYLELYGVSDPDAAGLVKSELLRRYPDFALPAPAEPATNPAEPGPAEPGLAGQGVETEQPAGLEAAGASESVLQAEVPESETDAAAWPSDAVAPEIPAPAWPSEGAAAEPEGATADSAGDSAQPETAASEPAAASPSSLEESEPTPETDGLETATEVASAAGDEAEPAREADKVEPEESPDAQVERPSSEVAVPPRNQEPSPSDAESGPRSAEDDVDSSRGSSNLPVEPLIQEEEQLPKRDPAPTPPESTEAESGEPI